MIPYAILEEEKELLGGKNECSAQANYCEPESEAAEEARIASLVTKAVS